METIIMIIITILMLINLIVYAIRLNRLYKEKKYNYADKGLMTYFIFFLLQGVIVFMGEMARLYLS